MTLSDATDSLNHYGRPLHTNDLIISYDLRVFEGREQTF